MFGTRRQRGEAIATTRGIPLIGWCSERTVARLATLGADLPFAVDQTLADEREPCGEFVVISKGVAVASIAGRPIATLGPGDFFGGGSRLIEATRAMTVTATTAARAFVFQPHQFPVMLETAPEIERGLRRAEAIAASEVTEAASNLIEGRWKRSY